MNTDNIPLPSEQILKDAESLKIYGRDWTRYTEPAPSAIVFPKTTEQVRDLVLWARQNKVPLVPSGGRTGLSGAALAAKQEVVVSFEKMNRILEFDEFDQTVRLEAGVVTEDLQQYAKEKNMYFPVDFASRGSSQIGGNVATNAGGIKVLRYGLFRNWVASLKVVTGTGEILELNRSLVKNATGYDLRQLFIGSEGTLGFITEITLKLANPAPPLNVLLLGVRGLDDVMKVFKQFRDNTQLEAFEMFTDVALKTVLDHAKDLKKPLDQDAPVYVILESAAADEISQQKILLSFEACLESGWILDGVIAQNETQAKQFWRLREDIAEACSPHTPYKNDISVRISQVPEFMREVDALLKKEYPDLDVIWFGHVGDGNLHINMLKPPSLAMADFVVRCRKVDTLLFSAIKKFGGSISAEHGVGLTKKAFLDFTRAPAEIDLMKKIKLAFDPDGIMNPGKIFDI